MNDVYGIDLAEPGLLERRSWRWLAVRIGGLLVPTAEFGAPSRLHLALFPPKQKEG